MSDSHFEFEGPPSLHRLDPAVIGNLSDDVLESALVGYVVDRWTQYGGESQGLAAMPSALAAWYVTFIVDGEVLNGGFNQLFFNASAGASPSAADAFETVGLPKAADIMRRALTLLEDHSPAIDEARAQGTIEAFMETYDEDPFQALDGEYAASQEEFRDQRIRFLRQQAQSIRHP